MSINRIKRRARALRGTPVQPLPPGEPKELPRRGTTDAQQHASLIRFMDSCVRYPLTGGNSVEHLENGDAAFPAMLKASDEARHSISLGTYIFDSDRAGDQFLAALREAMQRGVEVRVLIDAGGARYSRRPMYLRLQWTGICTKRFMRWRFRYMNLRNHRKIMVIDGTVAFTAA